MIAKGHKNTPPARLKHTWTPLWYTLMCPLGGLLPDIFVRAQTWKSITFVGNVHFLV